MSNKYVQDATVLGLQHALDEARAEVREATDAGCSDDLVLALMDAEDSIVSKLLAMGCHLRDC